MNINKNIAYFQNLTKTKHCKLIAVSKMKSEQDIMHAYDAGQRIFGENRAQELASKYEKLPKDIQWHMIGHLQTNKVKIIAPFVSMIESVDSIKLCREINKEAMKVNQVIPILLQVHIAMEETKFGFNSEELLEAIGDNTIKQFENVELKGLMAMATLTDDNETIRKEFRFLKNLFDKVASLQVFPKFTEISMGMTSDYEIALEEGSTMIRIGSAIFGERK